ncbi:MAG: hypothetical protein IJX78_04675 [Bacilli bacterium]|nr:hypothetical protein [Bacilli bacterium]
MNNGKGIYIYQDKWVESTALSNPLITLDHKMNEEYNDFYRVNYDLKLVAIEINDLLDNYNRYKEQIAQISIEELELLSVNNKSNRVLLNCFNQSQFEFISKYIGDVEILYLHKCRNIKDLSIISNFKNLKCLHIFNNIKIEKLWDVSKNEKLKALSFIQISKLNNIEGLLGSNVEYMCFDSSDIYGKTKRDFEGKVEIIKQLKNLKHVKMVYHNIKIDY